ncbi:hypothetical protein BHM03_00040130 [Ensete ventricosum]|nr:hypothetical protein BHM03_00040130 [Ensete ventricosum]
MEQMECDRRQLWPDPMSLCNACGIRYRKSRRAVPRFDEAGVKEKREVDGGGERFSVSFKLLMLGSGLCKSTSMDRKQRRRRRRRSVLGEEEQAAVLLMALSSGFLYA